MNTTKFLQIKTSQDAVEILNTKSPQIKTRRKKPWRLNTTKFPRKTPWRS